MEKAICTAPKQKAVGTDEVFVESLQIVPELAAKVMMELWQACGRVGHIPREWHKTFLLYPLFKRGKGSDPSNCRPLALLSHLRKLAEKIIDWELRGTYKFCQAQCGFTENRGIESVSLRAMLAHEKGRRIAAV